MMIVTCIFHGEIRNLLHRRQIHTTAAHHGVNIRNILLTQMVTTLSKEVR